MRCRPPGRRALVALAVPACALALAAGAADPAQAGPLARALDHLAATQDPDRGGFGAGGGTDPAYTAWAVLAVSAAGEDPADWRTGDVTLRRALVRPARDPSLGEVCLIAVAAASAGIDPRRVGGRNLVREVLLAQRADGSIGPDAATTAWGIMALVAGGLGPGSASVRTAASALEAGQADDGGWPLADDAPASGVNTTAAAVQALVAAGRDPDRSAALRRARAYLLEAQNGDGGFSPAAGGTSTALTTAWVALAIRAFDERPSRAPWNRGGGPLALVEGFQGRDGGVRNATDSTESSVWATAQLALALAGRPLPQRRDLRREVPARAPHLLARTPDPGERIGDVLRIRYADDDGGTGVAASEIRLRIGDRDLTDRADITATRLRLDRSAIPRGRPLVRLRLADRAGNTRTIRWRIVVPGR